MDLSKRSEEVLGDCVGSLGRSLEVLGKCDQSLGETLETLGKCDESLTRLIIALANKEIAQSAADAIGSAIDLAVEGAGFTEFFKVCKMLYPVENSKRALTAGELQIFDKTVESFSLLRTSEKTQITLEKEPLVAIAIETKVDPEIKKEVVWESYIKIDGVKEAFDKYLRFPVPLFFIFKFEDEGTEGRLRDIAEEIVLQFSGISIYKDFARHEIIFVTKKNEVKILPNWRSL